MAVNELSADGCTGWCCKVDTLSKVPPRPDGVAWSQHAPCLTGRQTLHLSRMWEAEYVERTGRKPRRVLTGWDELIVLRAQEARAA